MLASYKGTKVSSMLIFFFHLDFHLYAKKNFLRPPESNFFWPPGLPETKLYFFWPYAKKSISEKRLKEGANLQHANHVKNVEFNNISDCIKFVFLRGQVVPQTRVSEKPYKVWVGLNNLASCEILTGECGCIAGYSESCKHVICVTTLCRTSCFTWSQQNLHFKKANLA